MTNTLRPVARVRGRLATVVGVLLVGALVGLSSTPALAPVAVLLAGGLILAGFVSARSLPRLQLDLRNRSRVVGVLAASWVLVLVGTNHNIRSDGPGGRAGSILLAGTVFISYLLIGSFTVMLVKARDRIVADPPPLPLPLFLFPIWVVATAGWARSPVRPIFIGLLLLVIGYLAWATIILGAASAVDHEELLGTVLRWYAWFCAVMTFLGFTIGPVYASRGIGNLNRWTWPAAHPGASALLLGAAFIIVISAPAKVLLMPPLMRVGVAVMMAAGLYLNNSRTSAAGTLAGVLVVVWLMGRERPILRVLGVPYLLASGALLVLLAGNEVGDYVLRGGSSAQLRTLNSRTQLYSIAVDSLHGPIEWLHGLGHGASNYVFVESGVAFAGNAHNSFLAFLVNDGLIGLVLGFGAVFWAVVCGFRLLATRLQPLAIPILGSMVHVAANATTSDAVAEPNMGWAMVALTIAAYHGERAHQARLAGEGDDEVARDVAVASRR